MVSIIEVLRFDARDGAGGGVAGFLMDVVWRHGGLKRLVGSQLNLAFVFFWGAFC